MSTMEKSARISILLPQEVYLSLVHPLATCLRKAGASVQIICAGPGPTTPACSSGRIVWDWTDFFLGPIEKFKPTSVIIWNGLADQSVSATNYIRRRYNTAIIEMGWLPQRGNMYCLSDAGGFSGLKRVPFTPGALTPDDKTAVENIKLRYATGAAPSGLPGKFIFVPMQLEHDTVIKHMSPHFKLMNKFLAYLLSVSPIPVVVKNHPKEPSVERPRGVVMADSNLPAHVLAKYSEAVVGINSTVLVESIIQHKRIVFHGDNVGEAVMLDGREYYNRPFKNILEAPLPSAEEFDFRLALLLRNQYDFANPPGWVVQRVLKGYFGPRRPGVDS